MSPPRVRRAGRAIDGILLLDKPSGLSSNAALQRVRRLYHARKAGHGGSLDPLATGMLPVCFGQATKACGELLGASKTYQATIRLGAATRTGDAEGEVVATSPVPELTDAGIDNVLASFVGERTQVPPMHSALKMGGRRLYELARRGEEVERSPRQIRIHALRCISFQDGLLAIEVRCSKGTYVRTLGEEIAMSLGTVGHLAALRRVSVEPFETARMIGLAELEALAGDDPAAIDRLLLPTDQALGHLPAVDLDAAQTAALLHGRSVTLAAAPPGEARAYDAAGRFLGVTSIAPGGTMRVRRLFVPGAG